MKVLAFVLFLALPLAHARTERIAEMQNTKSDSERATLAGVREASPVLERYTHELLRGHLWKAPDLSERDRSMVTVSASIARNRRVELLFYHGAQHPATANWISNVVVDGRLVAGQNPASAAEVGEEMVKLLS